MKELNFLQRSKLKNKILFLFLFSITFFFCTKSTLAQYIFLPNYTTKDGLPSNHCFYTLQDKKGFIWVATDAGVSRFDGSVFENFSVDDGLPDNQILKLHEDSKGRLWFLALNGQLSFFYNGKIYNRDNFKALADLNFNGVIVSFFEDSKARIWFGTNNNVIGMWDGKNVKKYIPNDDNHRYQNSFIYEDSTANIWAISNKGNFIFSKNNFKPAIMLAKPISDKTIAHATQKYIYFLDNTGLKTLSGNTVSNILPLSKQLTNSNLGYIYANDTELWLSSGDGVTEIKNNGQSNSYLKGIHVSQVIEDKTGNMWFTTKNGIYKMPQLKDRLYLYQSKNKKDHAFQSITKDGQDRLWLGSANGNIHILPIKSRKKIILKLQDTVKFNVIKQLVYDKQTDQMLFASDYGLGGVSSSYPNHLKLNFLKEAHDNFYVVKSFSIDTTKRLSIAMSSGVVVIKDRNRLEFSALDYKEQEDFFKNRSYRVFYDQAQKLWFSNVDGLSNFRNSTLNQYFKQNPLLTKRINDIVEIKSNEIALATDGYGIILLKDGKVNKVFNLKNGLHNNIINKLFVRGNQLWAIRNTGINRINLAVKQPKISSFDDVNGILADNLNDLYITQDTAYFATNNGLIYFTKNHSLQHTKAPSVYITNISNHNQQLDIAQSTFTLAPKHQEITISYTAIDFNHKNITYRYRLKSNTNWVETKNRKLELSSLAAGHYTLEISAKNQNSDWSIPAKIELIFENNFYQTWWFISLCLLLGSYSIYRITVHFTRMKKNKEQEELLLKNKILMLEQKALQAMMNPHFVFNVMNSIQHYINTQNNALANKVLTGFARLIRKNLEICTQSYISLADELKYLELYLSLEKNRFGDKLQYEITVATTIDTEETFLPSMFLQPYIENAIWHGIMPKENGGKITIAITEEPSAVLMIKIIDDGVGIDNAQLYKKEQHNSKGMTLISDRIKLINQIEAKTIQLDIKQNGKSGTIVSISIPITD